jgi:hypothetical protein
MQLVYISTVQDQFRRMSALRLVAAAARGGVAEVQRLSKDGALWELDALGRSTMQMAISDGRNFVVKCLIEEGVALI